jgi:hypothetical protein
LREFFALMGDGKTDEARFLVEGDAQSIAEARKALELRERNNAFMQTVLVNALVPVLKESDGQPIQKARDDDADDVAMDARGQVLAIAQDLAEKNNGVVTLEAVVAAVAKRGIDLKSSRPGTSIGNILFKASAVWDRKGPGVFELKL